MPRVYATRDHIFAYSAFIAGSRDCLHTCMYSRNEATRNRQRMGPARSGGLIGFSARVCSRMTVDNMTSREHPFPPPEWPHEL